MSRLECSRCRCVYGDVVRVKKCVLCGNRDFGKVELDFVLEVKEFPRWFTRENNIGYGYIGTIRTDEKASV